MFYSQRIHDKCYRRPHFDAGQFVEQWDDEQARARATASTRWAARARRPTTPARPRAGTTACRFPIQSGHGCIGCSEDGFWDNGPFYDRLTDVTQFGHRGQRRPDRRHGRRRRRRRHRRPCRRHAPSSRRAAKTTQRRASRRGELDHGDHPDPRLQLDNSGKRIVVDPVTRIEGHLRIEVKVDENNVIRNAVSTGTMWRGLEVILKGRDPRDAWAFAERICGVCTGVHALASVRAVEDALGIKIPENANMIRNLMQLDAVRAGPPGALLSPARARLGRRRLRAEGRPEGDLRAGAVASRSWPQVLAGLFPRRAEPAARSSSRAASSAPSRTATGATRPTSCRPKPT